MDAVTPRSNNSVMRLILGSVKESPRKAGRKQTPKLPHKVSAMIQNIPHVSSLEKEEKPRMRGHQLERPKVMLQIGNKISHSQK